MTEARDPYKVLGVDYAAEPEVVATAYRALARSHHPDVSREDDAEARMAEINAAWAILRDPVRRAAYDLEHGVLDGFREARTSNPLRAMQERAKQTSATTRASSTGTASSPHSTSAWQRGPNGEGAAGPPPGRPTGSVLQFGRHRGWSLGEIARVDPGYLQWLAARREGEPYHDEIEALLAAVFRASDGPTSATSAQNAQRKIRFGR
jgi:curved DNA-binding protein CbpA